MNLAHDLQRALSRVVVGSIGPVTSAELRLHGINVDLEPSHPKMGFLVQEMSQQYSALKEKKRIG
jgi:uroporphyrinogen-III synthase